jgi:hypothetical protein
VLEGVAARPPPADTNSSSILLLSSSPHTPEHRQAFLLRSLLCRRVIEAPVQELESARKDGAPFPGVLANRNDVRNVLSQEAGHVLGFLMRDVNSNFSHGFYRQRIQPPRLDAAAESFEAIARHVPEVALGHLAPG